MLLRRYRKMQEPQPKAPVISNENIEHKEEQKYTKTDINRMTTAELQAFALEKGIDNADNMTGGDLKKVLIEKLGL